MSLEEFRQGLASLLSLQFGDLVKVGIFAEWQAVDYEKFWSEPFHGFYYGGE